MKEVLTIALLLGATACTKPAAPAGADSHAVEATPPTNRVAIPEAVRANLGITFARVEERAVSATLRVPGRFESLPASALDYTMPADGRVEVLVEPFDDVAEGDALFTLAAPDWSEHRQQILALRSDVERSAARLAALDQLEAKKRAVGAQVSERIAGARARAQELEDLLSAGGGGADMLAAARADVLEQSTHAAEVEFEIAELAAERNGLVLERAALAAAIESQVQVAAAWAGVHLATTPSTIGSVPAWLSQESLTVHAVNAGRVELVAAADASWLVSGAAVLTVVDPTAVVFRARVLQSDLGLLADGQPCRIASPSPSERARAIPLGESLTGVLRIATVANAHDNTVDVFVEPTTLANWARPGVAARLEIEYDATADKVLAIPLATVQRDGLVPVIFRRDPANQDLAIRIEADVGLHDGRWVAIASGVRLGDEIVLDGAFQLLLATSGSFQKGGHFHADGTFHEGED